ncbi:hypothetical protein C8Q72DRAFT_794722 [Fomitopsis betulina]|nr:hypothetical protein C8Q72DRAFT_794722 [Fomitopsis betulina]
MTLTKHGGLRSFVTTGPLRATQLFTTTFKLYEHSTNITLKRVIKKKGKESGDEDQADMDLNEGGNVLLESWLNKVSGRYPLLSVGDSLPYDTTILLLETGPWKQGASKLIVGALRMLWFHIPFNRIDNFYRVLQQASELVSQGQHVLAEEKWIVEGFALPIRPIDVYHGQLRPLFDNFLESLQESLNIILDMLQEMWTTPEVNVKLRQLNNREINEMYGTYLDCLIARPKMDFKHIIKGLVVNMPDTMHLKAEEKAGVKAEEVMKANNPLTEQTEEIYKELRARKLKRKHNLMEVDGTGERKPKVASLSTSGLVQGSDCGSMSAHQK